MRFKTIKAEDSPVGIEYYHLEAEDKKALIFSPKQNEFLIECQLGDKGIKITLLNATIKEAKKLAKELLNNDLDVSKCGYSKKEE